MAYHLGRQWTLADGVYLRHQYPTRHQLSWWDDVGFQMRHYRVMVWWVHPRMAYSDLAEEHALNLMDMPESELEPDFSSSPIHVKSGKSRKRVTAYQMHQPCPEHLLRAANWLAEVAAEESRFKQQSDLVITPSLKLQQTDWCRGMNLVAPVEVRTREDAISLGHLARRLYTQETTLDAEFPGYSYTRDSYLAEQAATTP